MKSIKTKIACFLGMLAMLMMGTTASAQLVQSSPGSEVVTAHLQTSDAVALKTYLTRAGYKETGLNQEGTVAYTNAEDATAPSNVIVVNNYRNAAGNLVELYSTSETVNGRTEYRTQAEDLTNDYIVSGGVVKVVAKAGINLQKIIDCYNKYLKGNTQACVNCFNCVKNCITGGGSKWKKLACCLVCAPSCWNCLTSIWKFFWCVF